MCQTSLKSNSLSFFIFQKKLSLLKKDFSKMLCLLLLGFLTGNIFGSFLNTIRQFFIWDGFITFCLITFIEFLSYLTYTQKKSSGTLKFFASQRYTQTSIRSTWFQFANLFKIGLLIGFFVDAFKVGS